MNYIPVIYEKNKPPSFIPSDSLSDHHPYAVRIYHLYSHIHQRACTDYREINCGGEYDRGDTARNPVYGECVNTEFVQAGGEHTQRTDTQNKAG